MDGATGMHSNHTINKQRAAFSDGTQLQATNDKMDATGSFRIIPATSSQDFLRSRQRTQRHLSLQSRQRRPHKQTNGEDCSSRRNASSGERRIPHTPGLHTPTSEAKGCVQTHQAVAIWRIRQDRSRLAPWNQSGGIQADPTLRTLMTGERGQRSQEKR